ncbi:MAG TPA: hypothetical protein VK886_14020 [Vicinamibacterales bacterium]|nr:hypothetical protein [Vicinamibacterales bacterium]
MKLKMMGCSTALVAMFAVSGCATMDQQADDRPVGTAGTTAPTEPTQVTGADPGEIPVGQEIDVRLGETLSSGTATAEQRFQATTVVDIKQGDRVLVPSGSVVRGIVSQVNPAGRVDRSGSMRLAFDAIVIRGREYPMRAMATQAFESQGIREEAATVGTAGAVGAVVGGILGGLKGALLGAVVGSGGVIAATEGKNVELPAGTIIRVRLDTPVQVR